MLLSMDGTYYVVHKKKPHMSLKPCHSFGFVYSKSKLEMILDVGPHYLLADLCAKTFDCELKSVFIQLSC